MKESNSGDAGQKSELSSSKDACGGRVGVEKKWGILLNGRPELHTLWKKVIHFFFCCRK